MKGLEISKAYYNEVVRPLLAQDLSHVLPFIAVGLCGEGSECFGFDDAISKDHSFGVRLLIWLNDEKEADYKDELCAFYDGLPCEYMGFSLVKANPFEKCRSGVYTISDFFETLTGYKTAPNDITAWLNIKEALFANALNGEVFFDGSGEFTARRNGFLSFYPDDVRFYLLAKHAALAAQSGQYNLTRLRLHEENTAAAMTKVYYVKHLMKLCFLANGKYMPFYKWAPKALSSLSECNELSVIIDELILENDIRKENALAEKAATLVIGMLRQKGYVSGESNYLMDYVSELLSKVKDSTLKLHPLDLSDM